METNRVDQPRNSKLLNRLPSESTTSPKRILYVIHWYELGGAEAYALYTIRTARALGHICYCISTVPSENSERATFASHCEEAIEYSGKDDGHFVRFLSDYMRQKRINVLHIHHSAAMYQSLPRIRGLFRDVLVVDSTHIVEYSDGGFPELSAIYADYIDRHNVISRNLIGVQQALYKRRFGRSLSAEKFYLTYLSNLAEPREIRPLNRHSTRKVITFYGRLVLQKQPNLFIAIVENLMKQCASPDVEAHIYGDGELRAALEARIERSIFRNQIHYMGRCDDQSKVLNATDILLVPSLNEGLSLTTFEALAHNRLVLSSDVGAQAEVLSPRCRIRLTPRLVEETVGMLATMLRDPEQYAKELRKNQRNLNRLRANEATPAAIAQLYVGL